MSKKFTLVIEGATMQELRDAADEATSALGGTAVSPTVAGGAEAAPAAGNANAAAKPAKASKPAPKAKEEPPAEAAEEEGEVDPLAEPESETEEETAAPTLEEVSSALKAVSKDEKRGLAEVRKILAEVGVDHIKKLKEDDYAKVLELCKPKKKAK